MLDQLIRWAWETDHDDKVPTVVAGIIPPLILILLIALYVSPWTLLTVVLVAALIVRSIRNERTEGQADWRVGAKGQVLRIQLDGSNPRANRVERSCR